MTPSELKNAAIKLFGERGYSMRLAEFLGMERTQVWRYLNGRLPVPFLVAKAVRYELQRRLESL
jgi:hypothetical protein